MGQMPCSSSSPAHSGFSSRFDSRRSRNGLVLAGAYLAALAFFTLLVIAVDDSPRKQYSVLDDDVQDPLADLDTSKHEWTDSHGSGYDPEQQNVFADSDAFDIPFVGYAPKDLKWRAPSQPEENVLDYLPSGKYSEPKSMELRALLGPYDPPKNTWDNMPLDY
ncbi:hypothetical protein GUITHDRAFT_166752 [Guillardia theta CCMP2712]|uniref:Uncharacterized protein n=1 Tax=Guillardia theta (strain CCMP2712) TaxID=905079 RepID=L1I7M1_GUITC|nr:hypothetical protein GUITHDRAFT_166752 [Guillardia theta CCMP2712]EKX32261.1 hypothetical protein GUITHDRAFT_166752 [Guillardia theta CCMP2712]|eukprot:XP_005819241.1 hypothetical protein GUITHDRAFT_166752 [Guillardia theta CCMP2712]